jgi:hypothetical protein
MCLITIKVDGVMIIAKAEKADTESSYMKHGWLGRFTRTDRYPTDRDAVGV